MLSKEDVDFIPDTSCYAEGIFTTLTISYLPFLVDSANRELQM